MSVRQRFAVVSLGSIGRRHVANLRSLRPKALIAACRLGGSTGGSATPEHCDLVFHSTEELIEFRPAAAVIASPASTHAQYAIALANAGIHLFVEKPLATSAAHAYNALKATDKAGVIAMVGYNLRCFPGLQEVKSAVDRGQIGRVYSVRAEVGQYLPEWRPDRDYRDSVSAQSKLGGGALLELSHEIDYLLWIFGCPNRLSAKGGHYSNLKIDVEDLIEIVLEYDSPRMLVSIHLDFLDRAGFRKLRIIGEQGTILWDGIEDRVSQFNADSRMWEPIAAERLATRNEMYVRELQRFLECIDSDKAPECDFRQGCEVLEVIDAARTAIQSGDSVEIGSHGG